MRDAILARRWLIAWLALTAVCFAQTSSSTQPWTTTNHWTAAITQGVLTGPLAVGASGDLYLANSIAGFSAPTKTFGTPSEGFGYVSRVNASGSPVFGVQLHGIYVVYAIGVDGAGNILIAGRGPAAGGLPITLNAYSSSPSGDQSAFACKLGSADGTPIFCTYLGTNQITPVAVGSDATGNVYIAGSRNGTPITTTPGALSLGDRGIIIMKLDPAGSKLLNAAAFGGSQSDGPQAMSVDGSGNVYILGATSSTDFPGVANGANPNPGSYVIAKVDPEGAKILYASYGSAQEFPVALAVDGSGAAYVAGVSTEIFVRKYTSAGTAIAYDTVLARTEMSSIAGMAVDQVGNVTLVGTTSSVAFRQHFSTATCREFNSPYTESGPFDTFVLRLAPDGGLSQSTFLATGDLVWTPAGSSGVISAQPGGAWVAIASNNLTQAGVLQIGPGSAAPSPMSIGCMSNAASFGPGAVAPGEIVSIFGEGLGPVNPAVWMLDANGRVVSTLAGVQVTFDDVPAPLLYVQDAQINAITPWELNGKTATKTCITYNGQSHCATASVGPAAPGVFSVSGVAAAVNQDGTVNSLQHPAPIGSIVSLFVTGLGLISPAPPDGSVVRPPLPILAHPVQVNFANPNSLNPAPVPGEVLYAGPAPFEVGGLFQINVRIPTSTVGVVLVQLPNGTTVASNGFLLWTPPSP